MLLHSFYLFVLSQGGNEHFGRHCPTKTLPSCCDIPEGRLGNVPAIFLFHLNGERLSQEPHESALFRLSADVHEPPSPRPVRRLVAFNYRNSGPLHLVFQDLGLLGWRVAPHSVPYTISQVCVENEELDLTDSSFCNFAPDFCVLHSPRHPSPTAPPCLQPKGEQKNRQYWHGSF